MKTSFAATAALFVGALLATACTEDEPGAEETIEEVDGVVPTLGARFDRIGRAELTNIALASPSTDKPLYNGEDSFAVSSSTQATFSAILTGTINRYDTFDMSDDLTDAQVSDLVGVLLDDQLRVDLSKPCNSIDGVSYLAIERGEFLGEEWTSCGGRTPNDDVIDHVLTLLTGGLNAKTQVKDNIGTWDKRTAEQKATFPYLAEPY